MVLLLLLLLLLLLIIPPWICAAKVLDLLLDRWALDRLFVVGERAVVAVVNLLGHLFVNCRAANLVVSAGLLVRGEVGFRLRGRGIAQLRGKLWEVRMRIWGL